MNGKTLYAQDVNYWRTGQRSVDTWMGMATNEIERVGGKITGEALIGMNGISMVSLMFELAGEAYRLTWPVLPVKGNPTRADLNAAKIQAATFLYHDVKAKCMVVKVMGARAAFAQYLLTEGTTIAEQGFAGNTVEIPRLLLGGGA